MIKKKFSYKSSRLTAEQESLLRQERELRQKEALLKRRLQKLPSLREEKLHRCNEHTKILHTTFAATSQSPELPSYREERPNYRGLPMKEKRAAKIKFVILVITLIALLILVWRSLPA